jgi:Tol biopolymer transport system component
MCLNASRLVSLAERHEKVVQMVIAGVNAWRPALVLGVAWVVASPFVGAGAEAADTKASEGAWGSTSSRNRLAGMAGRVSAGPSARQPNGESSSPVISASGRYVVFPSSASNLVPQDTNRGVDVFVRDRVARVTQRVSVGPGGRQAKGNNAFNDSPAVSRSGRYVAFSSFATNLVPADTNRGLDVFVRDRVARVTRRVSLGPDGRQGRGFSGDPSISADGRYVAFES